MDQPPVPQPLAIVLDLLRKACASLLSRTAADDATNNAKNAAAVANKWAKKKERNQAVQDAKNRRAKGAIRKAAKVAANRCAKIKAGKNADDLDDFDKATSTSAPPRDGATKADHAKAKKAAAKAKKKAAKKAADLDALDKATATSSKEESAPSPSATTPASPAAAGPSSSAQLPSPQDEDIAAHARYWELNRALKRKNWTLCMVCFLERGHQVPLKNDDNEIDRHVRKLHKPRVRFCKKPGCFIFGRDLRQIGMHQDEARH